METLAQRGGVLSHLNGVERDQIMRTQAHCRQYMKTTTAELPLHLRHDLHLLLELAATRQWQQQLQHEFIDLMYQLTPRICRQFASQILSLSDLSPEENVIGLWSTVHTSSSNASAATAAGTRGDSMTQESFLVLSASDQHLSPSDRLWQSTFHIFSLLYHLSTCPFFSVQNQSYHTLLQSYDVTISCARFLILVHHTRAHKSASSMTANAISSMNTLSSLAAASASSSTLQRGFSNPRGSISWIGQHSGDAVAVAMETPRDGEDDTTPYGIASRSAANLGGASLPYTSDDSEDIDDLLDNDSGTSPTAESEFEDVMISTPAMVQSAIGGRGKGGKGNNNSTMTMNKLTSPPPLINSHTRQPPSAAAAASSATSSTASAAAPAFTHHHHHLSSSLDASHLLDHLLDEEDDDLDDTTAHGAHQQKNSSDLSRSSSSNSSSDIPISAVHHDPIRRFMKLFEAHSFQILLTCIKAATDYQMNHKHAGQQTTTSAASASISITPFIQSDVLRPLLLLTTSPSSSSAHLRSHISSLINSLVLNAPLQVVEYIQEKMIVAKLIEAMKPILSMRGANQATAENEYDTTNGLGGDIDSDSSNPHTNPSSLSSSPTSTAGASAYINPRYSPPLSYLHRLRTLLIDCITLLIYTIRTAQAIDAVMCTKLLWQFESAQGYETCFRLLQGWFPLNANANTASSSSLDHESILLDKLLTQITHLVYLGRVDLLPSPPAITTVAGTGITMYSPEYATSSGGGGGSNASTPSVSRKTSYRDQPQQNTASNVSSAFASPRYATNSGFGFGGGGSSIARTVTDSPSFSTSSVRKFSSPHMHASSMSSPRNQRSDSNALASPRRTPISMLHHASSVSSAASTALTAQQLSQPSYTSSHIRNLSVYSLFHSLLVYTTSSLVRLNVLQRLHDLYTSSEVNVMAMRDRGMDTVTVVMGLIENSEQQLQEQSSQSLPLTHEMTLSESQQEAWKILKVLLTPPAILTYSAPPSSRSSNSSSSSVEQPLIGSLTLPQLQTLFHTQHTHILAQMSHILTNSVIKTQEPMRKKAYEFLTELLVGREEESTSRYSSVTAVNERRRTVQELYRTTGIVEVLVTHLGQIDDLLNETAFGVDSITNDLPSPASFNASASPHPHSSSSSPSHLLPSLLTLLYHILLNNLSNQTASENITEEMIRRRQYATQAFRGEETPRMEMSSPISVPAATSNFPALLLSLLSSTSSRITRCHILRLLGLLIRSYYLSSSMPRFIIGSVGSGSGGTLPISSHDSSVLAQHAHAYQNILEVTVKWWKEWFRKVDTEMNSLIIIMLNAITSTPSSSSSSSTQPSTSPSHRLPVGFSVYQRDLRRLTDSYTLIYDVIRFELVTRTTGSASTNVEHDAASLGGGSHSRNTSTSSNSSSLYRPVSHPSSNKRGITKRKAFFKRVVSAPEAEGEMMQEQQQHRDARHGNSRFPHRDQLHDDSSTHTTTSSLLNEPAPPSLVLRHALLLLSSLLRYNLRNRAVFLDSTNYTLFTTLIHSVAQATMRGGATSKMVDQIVAWMIGVVVGEEMTWTNFGGMMGEEKDGHSTATTTKTHDADDEYVMVASASPATSKASAAPSIAALPDLLTIFHSSLMSSALLSSLLLTPSLPVLSLSSSAPSCVYIVPQLFHLVFELFQFATYGMKQSVLEWILSSLHIDSSNTISLARSSCVSSILSIFHTALLDVQININLPPPFIDMLYRIMTLLLPYASSSEVQTFLGLVDAVMEEEVDGVTEGGLTDGTLAGNDSTQHDSPKATLTNSIPSVAAAASANKRLLTSNAHHLVLQRLITLLRAESEFEHGWAYIEFHVYAPIVRTAAAAHGAASITPPASGKGTPMGSPTSVALSSASRMSPHALPSSSASNSPSSPSTLDLAFTEMHDPLLQREACLEVTLSNDNASSSSTPAFPQHGYTFACWLWLDEDDEQMSTGGGQTNAAASSSSNISSHVVPLYRLFTLSTSDSSGSLFLAIHNGCVIVQSAAGSGSSTSGTGAVNTTASSAAPNTYHRFQKPALSPRTWYHLTFTHRSHQSKWFADSTAELFINGQMMESIKLEYPTPSGQAKVKAVIGNMEKMSHFTKRGGVSTATASSAATATSPPTSSSSSSSRVMSNTYLRCRYRLGSVLFTSGAMSAPAVRAMYDPYHSPDEMIRSVGPRPVLSASSAQGKVVLTSEQKARDDALLVAYYHRMTLHSYHALDTLARITISTPHHHLSMMSSPDRSLPASDVEEEDDETDLEVAELVIAPRSNTPLDPSELIVFYPPPIPSYTSLPTGVVVRASSTQQTAVSAAQAAAERIDPLFYFTPLHADMRSDGTRLLTNLCAPSLSRSGSGRTSTTPSSNSTPPQMHGICTGHISLSSPILLADSFRRIGVFERLVMSFSRLSVYATYDTDTRCQMILQVLVLLLRGNRKNTQEWHVIHGWKLLAKVISERMKQDELAWKEMRENNGGGRRSHTGTRARRPFLSHTMLDLLFSLLGLSDNGLTGVLCSEEGFKILIIECLLPNLMRFDDSNGNMSVMSMSPSTTASAALSRTTSDAGDGSPDNMPADSPNASYFLLILINSIVRNPDTQHRLESLRIMRAHNIMASCIDLLNLDKDKLRRHIPALMSGRLALLEKTLRSRLIDFISTLMMMEDENGAGTGLIGYELKILSDFIIKISGQPSVAVQPPQHDSSRAESNPQANSHSSTTSSQPDVSTTADYYDIDVDRDVDELPSEYVAQRLHEISLYRSEIRNALLQMMINVVLNVTNAAMNSSTSGSAASRSKTSSQSPIASSLHLLTSTLTPQWFLSNFHGLKSLADSLYQVMMEQQAAQEFEQEMREQERAEREEEEDQRPYGGEEDDGNQDEDGLNNSPHQYPQSTASPAPGLDFASTPLPHTYVQSVLLLLKLLSILCARHTSYLDAFRQEHGFEGLKLILMPAEYTGKLTQLAKEANQKRMYPSQNEDDDMDADGNPLPPPPAPTISAASFDTCLPSFFTALLCHTPDVSNLFVHLLFGIDAANYVLGQESARSRARMHQRVTSIGQAMNIDGLNRQSSNGSTGAAATGDVDEHGHMSILTILQHQIHLHQHNINSGTTTHSCAVRLITPEIFELLWLMCNIDAIHRCFTTPPFDVMLKSTIDSPLLAIYLEFIGKLYPLSEEFRKMVSAVRIRPAASSLGTTQQSPQQQQQLPSLFLSGLVSSLHIHASCRELFVLRCKYHNDVMNESPDGSPNSASSASTSGGGMHRARMMSIDGSNFDGSVYRARMMTMDGGESNFRARLMSTADGSSSSSNTSSYGLTPVQAARARSRSRSRSYLEEELGGDDSAAIARREVLQRLHAQNICEDVSNYDAEPQASPRRARFMSNGDESVMSPHDAYSYPDSNSSPFDASLLTTITFDDTISNTLFGLIGRIVFQSMGTKREVVQVAPIVTAATTNVTTNSSAPVTATMSTAALLKEQLAHAAQHRSSTAQRHALTSSMSFSPSAAAASTASTTATAATSSQSVLMTPVSGSSILSDLFSFTSISAYHPAAPSSSTIRTYHSRLLQTVCDILNKKVERISTLLLGANIAVEEQTMFAQNVLGLVNFVFDQVKVRNFMLAAVIPEPTSDVESSKPLPPESGNKLLWLFLLNLFRTPVFRAFITAHAHADVIGHTGGTPAILSASAMNQVAQWMAEKSHADLLLTARGEQPIYGRTVVALMNTLHSSTLQLYAESFGIDMFKTTRLVHNARSGGGMSNLSTPNKRMNQYGTSSSSTPHTPNLPMLSFLSQTLLTNTSPCLDRFHNPHELGVFLYILFEEGILADIDTGSGIIVGTGSSVNTSGGRLKSECIRVFMKICTHPELAQACWKLMTGLEWYMAERMYEKEIAQDEVLKQLMTFTGPIPSALNLPSSQSFASPTASSSRRESTVAPSSTPRASVSGRNAAPVADPSTSESPFIAAQHSRSSQLRDAFDFALKGNVEGFNQWLSSLSSSSSAASSSAASGVAALEGGRRGISKILYQTIGQHYIFYLHRLKQNKKERTAQMIQSQRDRVKMSYTVLTSEFLRDCTLLQSTLYSQDQCKLAISLMLWDRYSYILSTHKHFTKYFIEQYILKQFSLIEEALRRKVQEEQDKERRRKQRAKSVTMKNDPNAPATTAAPIIKPFVWYLNTGLFHQRNIELSSSLGTSVASFIRNPFNLASYRNTTGNEQEEKYERSGENADEEDDDGEDGKGGPSTIVSPKATRHLSSPLITSGGGVDDVLSPEQQLQQQQRHHSRNHQRSDDLFKSGDSSAFQSPRTISNNNANAANAGANASSATADSSSTSSTSSGLIRLLDPSRSQRIMSTLMRFETIPFEEVSTRTHSSSFNSASTRRGYGTVPTNMFKTSSSSVNAHPYAYFFSQLCNAIYAYDEVLLPIERVRDLITLLPTTNEMTLINEYLIKNPDQLSRLNMAEYFISIISSVTYLEERLTVWLYQRTFHEQFEYLQGRSLLIQNILNEMKLSKRLHLICRLTMKVLKEYDVKLSESSASQSSEPTTSDASTGFRLSYLQLLSSTHIKSTSGKDITLLQVFVEQLLPPTSASSTGATIDSTSSSSSSSSSSAHANTDARFFSLDLPSLARMNNRLDTTAIKHDFLKFIQEWNVMCKNIDKINAATAATAETVKNPSCKFNAVTTSFLIGSSPLFASLLQTFEITYARILETAQYFGECDPRKNAASSQVLDYWNDLRKKYAASATIPAPQHLILLLTALLTAPSSSLYDWYNHFFSYLIHFEHAFRRCERDLMLARSHTTLASSTSNSDLSTRRRSQILAHGGHSNHPNTATTVAPTAAIPKPTTSYNSAATRMARARSDVDLGGFHDAYLDTDSPVASAATPVTPVYQRGVASPAVGSIDPSAQRASITASPHSSFTPRSRGASNATNQ